jgi:ubiquinol-cytochrome c reductase cytochrome c subunit
MGGPRIGPDPIPFDILLRYVRKPTGEMPPYTAKVISDQELADIYAFLQSRARPATEKAKQLLK